MFFILKFLLLGILLFSCAYFSVSIPLVSIGSFFIFCVLMLSMILNNGENRKTITFDQLSYLRTYKFPKELFSEMKNRNPHLNDTIISAAFEGLRQFFVSIYYNPDISFGCPSKLVEEAWVTFYNNPEYRFFCRNVSGRYIAPEKNYLSTGKSKLATTFSNSVKNTWNSQIQHSKSPISIVKLENEIPFIFYIDTKFSKTLTIDGAIIFNEADIKELILASSTYELSETKGVKLTQGGASVYYAGLGGGRGCNYFTSTPQIDSFNNGTSQVFYVNKDANPNDYPT